MTGSDIISTEGKRARVRRLLINPLIADGFRKRAKEADDKHHDFLDRVADDLAYMSDEKLRVLRDCLASKGEGSAKHFWPCYATIIGFAQLAQPRPIEELPRLLSWFRSKAGPEALAAGRHVAEYEFWKKYHRPPMREECERVQAQADKWNTKANRCRNILAERGRLQWPQDQQWLDWYDGQSEYVRGLIEGQAG